MGGPSAPSPPPAPPSAGETTKESIQAQISSLPDILQAQQQYGPQFSQTALDQLQKYGPEFSQALLDLQKQFGPQYQDLQNQLAPDVAAAKNTLTQFLNGNDQQEYDQLSPYLQQDIRSAQSQRGLGDVSPLGAIDEASQLAQLREQLKSRRLNIALSTAGRTPIGSAPVATSPTGQLVQNVDPQSIFGYQGNLNNYNASIYNTQKQFQQPSFFQTLAGNVAGRGLGSLSSGLGLGLANSVFPSLLG